MSPGYVILIAFALMILLGEPLFVMIGTVTLLAVNLAGHGFDASAVVNASSSVVLAITKITNSELLISIPLFTLAGTIMTHGGISPRLIAIVRALVGWLPGGLAIACVVACTVFAAISGSSSVTIIAIGGIIYPALRKEGYGDRFALGLITICGAVGMLIPPSLPLIVYGVIAGNSVASGKPSIDHLFLAGMGPSLLAVAGLACYSAVVGSVRGVPWLAHSIRPFSPARAARGFADWLWNLLAVSVRGVFALAMPVLLLGMIYGGFATVHETSAFAVLYALVVELFIHRAVKPRALYRIAVETVILVGSIMIILVMAFSFSDFLTDAKIPDAATDIMRYDRVYDSSEFETYTGRIIADEAPAALVIVPKDDPAAQEKSLDDVRKKAADRHSIARANVGSIAHPLVGSKLSFLLAVNVLLLVVGSIMDIYSAIVCLAPLLVPMAQAYGVDLVHLGIIFAFNLELGLAHPPLGINLFIAQSYFRKTLLEVTLAALPFIGLFLGLLGIVTYWDTLSLWTVAHLGRGHP